MSAAATLLVVMLSACSAGTSATQRIYALGGRAMVDCSISGSGGGVVAAKCGTLTVPENRQQKGGRSIGLYIAVLPATSKTTVGEPVFFIAGGPGSSTVEQWSQAASIFWGLNDHHDIVLVDQRGTGQSHPLMVPAQNPGETPAGYASRALATMDGDPRFYTTAVAIDDLDTVRQSLGYSKIDLYGGSYGATAVQYYIRQHADRVYAAVLDGGTLLDVPIFELIAPNSQRALDDVFNRCAAEAACAQAFPNVRAEFAMVLDRLQRAPVPTDIQDAGGEQIIVTADLFAGAIHQLMVVSDSAEIPWLVHKAWSGNFAEVAGQVTRVFPGPSPTPVMSIEIMCTEAWARHDAGQVSAFGQGSYYLSSELSWAQMMDSACKYVPPGYVTANDDQPVRTSLPVLLLNGIDDPQDPPANVAGARHQMPNSLSVTPSGLGHTVGHIGCLPQLVVRYFDTGKTDAAAAQACLATMRPPSFRLN